MDADNQSTEPSPAVGSRSLNSTDPAGDTVTATYLVPQRRIEVPRSQSPRNGAGVMLHPPRGSRPTSARTRPQSASLFSPDVKPIRKEPMPGRPGSAPGKKDERLRTEMYAIRTPGEDTLHAPLISPRGPGQTPVNKQLQFELGVTASVLRAAQTRLAQEREQRQIARIGEERALIDMKRAKQEAKLLSEEKIQEEFRVAMTMAEQRQELEKELTRIESEQEVSTAAIVP